MGPERYGWSLWGCEMGIRFPVVKLIDWKGREEELLASRNPFALITQAFLDRLEAEKSMPYVTSVERIAKQEGRQEGRQEGWVEGRVEALTSMLLAQLAQRFGQLPEWASQKLKSATPEALEGWALRILEARSLEEIFA